jgi:2-methylisocitrate lyase-like PEP mutase family enzyme
VAASARARLRQLLGEPGILVAPGAYNALVARQVEDAGFRVCYATGAGIANAQLGLPDVGLLSFGEIVQQVRYICGATELPVIADADTGYGNPLNVFRTVREFEGAGAAAIQLEDQVDPKRCGHFDGKDVIPAEEMVQKVRAARDARRDPQTLIVARTDARAALGLEEALRRARLYHDAGAEVTFVEAPQDEAELRAVGALGFPQVANMVEGGRTPLLGADELAAMGFKVVLFANAPLRAGLRATAEILEHLRRRGTTADALDRVASFEQRHAATRMGWIRELEARYRG